MFTFIHVQDELTTPFELFVGDLREFGGDNLKEMDIDFWEVNAFELPMFQGEEACTTLVRLTLQKWVPVFEEFRDTVYDICISKVSLFLRSPLLSAARSLFSFCLWRCNP